MVVGRHTDHRKGPLQRPFFYSYMNNLKRPQQNKQQKVTFGYWAALQGNTQQKQFIGLNTGYLWGQSMTLLNMTNSKKISVTPP